MALVIMYGNKEKREELPQLNEHHHILLKWSIYNTVKPRSSNTICLKRLFEKRFVRNPKFRINVTFISWL